MQRIDENTYIDDTLVTCAEYQLFIDEMREQEKYYQPDHWTSYQFPAGQAREPILGVRLGDAKSFCEWLTSRDSMEWNYRLPRVVEAAKIPLQVSLHFSLGFWLLEEEFTWATPISSNPRGLEDYRIFTLSRPLSEAIARFRDGGKNSIFCDHFVDNYNRVEPFLIRELAELISQRCLYPLDLVGFRERSKNSFDDLNPFVWGLNRTLDNALSLAFRNALSVDQTYDVIIDFITLQERIAGRSPAFEGIRLVKERIR